MTQQRATSTAQVPSPPRESGGAQQDARAIVQWLQTFYSILVRETGLLDPSFQASGGDTIDLENLPDPTATTLAQAQAVANAAYQVAAGQKSGIGSFTLAGTNNFADVAFGTPLPSTDYVVMLTVSATSGTPVPADIAVASIVKSTDKFRVSLAVYPGNGKSVTYDYAVFLKG